MPETAVILAGGQGTRMRELLGDQPKALAPLEGRPFIEHQLAFLAGSGVREVVISTGHGADQVEAHCGDGARWSIRIRYCREERPLGTGGAARLAAGGVSGDPFLVLNGDSLLAADLAELAALHATRDAVATLALTHVEDRARFGSVRLGPDSAVAGFVEKGEPGGGWVSAGLYLLTHRCLEGVVEGEPASIELDVFPRWVGGGLCAYLSEAPYVDIGTPDSYRRALAGSR